MHRRNAGLVEKHRHGQQLVPSLQEGVFQANQPVRVELNDAGCLAFLVRCVQRKQLCA